MKKRFFIALTVLTSLLFMYCTKSRFPTLHLVGKLRPKLIGKDFKLLPEAAESFKKMRFSAHKEGIKLYSVSSYRDFSRQKGIWERKWARYEAKGLKGGEIAKEIIKYSTMPGTSRHHWGTDLDVIDANVIVSGDKLLEKHFTDNGAYEKLHRWLSKNANRYGFYLVYTSNPERKGFEYEPWHLSYKPLSQDMYREYLKINWQQELKGVKGIDELSEDFFENYQKQQIEGINPILK